MKAHASPISQTGQTSPTSPAPTGSAGIPAGVSASPRFCPVTGRPLAPQPQPRPRLGFFTWLFTGFGLASLVWFLVRVIPKPSRAAYPCQRLAFPAASGFVLWLLALLGSASAWRRAHDRMLRFAPACLWGAVALAGFLLVAAHLPAGRSLANPPHGPIGSAIGIFPGRVAWVYAPEVTANQFGVTNWAGYSSTEHWYETNHTDIAVVETMMSTALQSITGAGSDAAAWDVLFQFFNQNHGKGARGYASGEKIAIKINLTTCNARSGTSTVAINTTYEKVNSYSDGKWLNTIDNSPQMLLTLLRQLVYTAGVDPTNIYLGDPTGNFPQYLWNRLHPEFPSVHYFDNYGGAGRFRTELSSVPFYWSATNANAGTVVRDYVPVPFAQADYIIDFAVLKGHSVGVTLCGKNFYGALLRCPDGYSRDGAGRDHGATLNYHNMHTSTPDPSIPGTPGAGHYRAIVDLLGSPYLGGKTMLWLVDGLYGGYFWDSHPKKWNMAPFYGNWPSSLFASLDPLAIDSVCYDFLLTEWPNVVNNGKDTAGTGLQGGAEDYLHEAAQANSPASGTFYAPNPTRTRLTSLGAHEHWNNSTAKQYSRNLDPVNGTGIELVKLTASRPAATLSIAKSADQAVLSWRTSLLGYRLQTASDPTGLWTNISGASIMSQWWNTVTNPVTGPAQFYRLTR